MIKKIPVEKEYDCQNCGVTFYRVSHGFQVRKYCSQKCAQQARSKWHQGGYV